MQTTTNGLKKYEGTDVPDLLTGYNASIDVIDPFLDSAFNPQPSTDPDFTVSMLTNCKVASNGAVYYVAPTQNGD